MPTPLPSRPEIIQCVWDKISFRYVPLSSPRGQEIYNTPPTFIEPRAHSVPIKVPLPVVEHPCGLSIPGDLRNGPLCGVLAVAVAAGRPLDEVYRYMARKHPGQWRGSTREPEVLSALDHYGVKYHQKIDLPYPYVKLQTWVQYFAKRDITYIITTTHHVQVVRNGFVIDQQGLKIFSDYWGKGKKVVRILEILK